MPLSLGVAPYDQGFAKYPTPTTDTVNAIFKQFYLPAVRDQLNSKRILSTYLRRNSEAISGEMAVLLLNVGRNEGIGFIGEQGRLPLPGKQQYQKALYRMRYDYGRIMFTGPAVSSSRNERGAFIRVVDSEMRGLVRDKQHENNRVLFGDGSGRLATVLSVASTAVVCQNPGGFTNVGPGVQYLRPGMRIGFLDPGTGNIRTVGSSKGYKILSVDPSTNAITVDDGTGAAAVTPAVAGDYIIRVADGAITAQEYHSTSYLNEPFGLAAMADDGNPFGGASPTPNFHNYGSIDASTVGIWRAPVVDNSGTPVLFAQDMLQAAQDALDIQSDGTVQIWITTHGIRRQYISQLVAAKRYVNTMQLDGGWTAVEYNGRPLVPDKDCTRGRIYGLDLDTLFMFVETDYQWMDADGSVLNRVPGYDAYEATLYRYWSTGGDARNRNVAIRDLIDS